MEDHAIVPVDVKSAAKRKRQSHYDPDLVNRAVTEARHIGAQAAARSINKARPQDQQVPEDTVRKWLSRFKHEGPFWEADPKKRGRKSIMDSAPPAVQKELLRQVDGIRAQGASVTGRVAASVGRAILSEKAPSLLARHGGDVQMSVATGRRILARTDRSYRKRTSTRIIPPPSEVEAARDIFYDSINDFCADGSPHPELVINFDQTFHLYDPSRGFTWEKKSSSRVQLKQNRDGFTFVPVVSAAGVVGAQFIFGGTTSSVYPRVAPGPMLSFTCNENHWSNEQTTIDLWKKIILPYIAKTRTALGDAAAPAIVLADAFPAHWTQSVRDIVSAQPSIAYISIPDSLTHLFQPLDLGIIAAIKQSVLRRKDDFFEKEVQTAVHEGRLVKLSKSRPILRDRTTAWLKEILADPIICAATCCRSGFSRAGIARLLWDDHDADVDVDEVIPSVFGNCTECGELGKKVNELPPCSHFVDCDSAMLCSGCLNNHTELCEPI